VASPSSDNAVYAYDNGYYPPATLAEQPGRIFDVSLSGIIGILRRRWLFLLLGSLLGLAVGLTVVTAFIPTFYKSSVRILIDRSANRYLQANKIAEEPAFDDMETGSQVHVLSSESIVLPVVRSMDLANDAEFVGAPKARGAESDWGIKHLIKAALGWSTAASIPPDVAQERLAVEVFLKRLTVSREDVANVINVTFASKDPQKAARLANAVADAYLESTIKAKLASNKLASQLLQERLVDLRKQLNDAEHALREHRLSANVAGTGTGLLYSAQMSTLNTRLITARIALVESKAKLEHGQALAGDASAPDNEVITRLRTQYLELGVAANEMESRVGPNHNAVIKIRKRMERLSNAIKEERERIASTLPDEHKLAKARYNELASAFAELTGEATTTSEAQVTLRELESSAEALRNLYNASLQKFNEINKAEPQTVPIQDARIITRAAPSLHRDARKPLAALGGSVVLGLLLGAAAALARDLGGGAFRTPGQVKTVADIYCGIMPAVEARRGTIPLFTRGTRPGMIEEYVLDAPYSRFAETIRGIKVLVDAAHRAGGDKVICVVSSVANEGKTTILTNLAAHMAATSPVRLLVIDCDLHRRRLTTRLAPEAREGLIEALEDPSRLAELVTRRDRSGLDILPCALATRIPNAAELLGSPRMQKLLDVARASYDFVLIEVPPIMSVVDVKTIERFIDRFIFVVEWGRTSRRLFQEALSEVAVIRDRLLCVVLNKADPAALRSIEAYKGARFGDYYQE
jgi:succinoglycan biosynthesis transport protein ExoP